MKSNYLPIGALLALVLLSTVHPAMGAGGLPTVQVQESVALAPRYSIFDLAVKSSVTISVNVTFSSPSTGPTTVTIQTFISPKAAPGSAAVGSSAAPLPLTPQVFLPARVIEPWTFVYTLPPDTSSATMLIKGSYTGSSIFWKDQVQVAAVSASGVYHGQTLPSNFTLVISQPNSADIKRVDAPYFTYKTAVVHGTVSLVSQGYGRGFIVILYQPNAWDAAAWALLGLTVIFLLLLPSRWFRERFLKRLHTPSRVVHPFRRAWAVLKGADSHKFLTVYIIISMLMLSLSFMGGPDPRVHVFVIASDSTTAQVQSTLQRSLGNVQILTPSDTESEFNTMATLGTVQVVVISDYNKLDTLSVEKYILNNLNLVPLTVVVGPTNTTLAEYTYKLYNQTSLNSGIPPINVASPSDLGTPQFKADVLRAIRPNSVGLKVGLTSYLGIAATVGILSFLVVTFGIAFLVSKLIEIGDRPLVSSLVEGMFYAGGVFFFTQAVYMASSAMLGWPLGLHAVTTGSGQVTVLGLFHLGAGNQPRTLAALVGLVIGAFPAMWSKVDRYVAFAIGALAFFVIVDPLTGGTVFFEFVVLLTGGPQVGFASASYLSIKTFLNQIGTDVAGWISGNFGISSGEMFYYFGAVPFALIPKLQKSTRTVVLLLCGFAASDGIVRVAEMTAYKTGPSMVAGALAGIVIAIAFLGLSRVEGYVRRYFPSRA